MKVIVLHGDDSEKSYARLGAFTKEAKKRDWEIVNDKIEETPSLFGTEKLIIIRNLKLIGKKELKTIEKIPGTLVIYSSKKIPATFLKTLSENLPAGRQVPKIELFELPFLLWKFLDDINLKTFQDVTKTQAPEMVFAMMTKRFRDLYWLKVGKPKMSPWQLSKLKKQADKFEEAELKTIINKLAMIDVKSKTGGPDLKTLLDIFIVKRLG